MINIINIIIVITNWNNINIVSQKLPSSWVESTLILTLLCAPIRARYCSIVTPIRAKCSIYILQGCIDQTLIGILFSENTMAPVVNSHQYASKIESIHYKPTSQNVIKLNIQILNFHTYLDFVDLYIGEQRGLGTRHRYLGQD